jgi:hypothetical protein
LIILAHFFAASRRLLAILRNKIAAQYIQQKNRAFRGFAIAPAPAVGRGALRAPYNPLRPTGWAQPFGLLLVHATRAGRALRAL